MSEQILNRVCQIAGDVMEAPVTRRLVSGDCRNWDSVRHLNLMLALEEEYGFEFLPEEMDEAKSVGQIAAMVASKRA